MQHLTYRKLYQIESYLHDRYYPFILEEIPDLYDKMQSICTISNELSSLLSSINEMSNQVVLLENKVGNDISYEDFDLLVNNVNDKIAEYKTKESVVINETDKLYEQVEVFVESCESDIKNSVVPLTIKEAQAILDKQDIVIKDLQREVAEYNTRTEELKEKIALLQKRNEEMGKEATPVNSADRDSIHQSLLWLYSLKRIVNHSIGIVEIQAGDTMVRVTFTGGIVLTVTIDEASHVVDGKLQIPDIFEKTVMTNGSGFSALLNESIGQHWNFLITNTLYYIYSLKRYTSEIELLRQKFTIDVHSEGQLRIQYPNFVVVDLKIPPDYPRTMEKVVVEHISTSDINQVPVQQLTTLLRGKAFYSITDLSNFTSKH